MKKQTVSLLVLLLAASGFFFSCGNIMNKNAGALEFDSIQVNETAHLFGDTAKPACNLIINLTYASKSSDEKMKDSLNTYFLSACFGEKYMNMTAEEAVKKYTEKYVSDYRKDLEPMYRKDEQDKESAEDIGAWYSYYKGIERIPCSYVFGTPDICSSIASTTMNIPAAHMAFICPHSSISTCAHWLPSVWTTSL